MTRGLRSGCVTKVELLKRLRAVPGGVNLKPSTSSLAQLLGHAIHHNLVNEHEVVETTPREETVLPCYLYTHITEEVKRQKIEAYVQASSQLYRRGSILVNLAAMDAYGTRLPGSNDLSVPVWRPRFSLAEAEGEEQATFTRWVMDAMADPKIGSFKHAFIPERWPSSIQERDTIIEATLQIHAESIPVLPDWLAVMSVSGWDNAINSMTTKYCTNAWLHVSSTLAKSAQDYFAIVRHPGSPSRKVMSKAIHSRLRPWVMHDDDWAMLLDIRGALGVPREDFLAETPEVVPVRADALRLHAFVTRNGSRSRSYFPVASRGRKFAYIDAKVACFLIPPKKKVQAIEGTTLSVGEMLGLTTTSFQRQRKALRTQLRREYRKKKRRETNGQRKERFAKLEKRWSRRGCGRMQPGARIDSVETDGVGLRLCMKTIIDISRFTVPVPLAAGLYCSTKPKKKSRRGRKSEETLPPCTFEKEIPLIVAVDTGRAKPFVAAISTNPVKKPKAHVFTRSRYYYEMHYHQKQKWEHERMASRPDIQGILVSLSESGGIHNCDVTKWEDYLEVESTHYAVLRDEYIGDKERALWRMRMFRWKRASLDKAVSGLIKAATDGIDTKRPLVLAVGKATFAPTGPGELAVPTSALSIAFRRGLNKHSASTGRNVLAMAPNEHRTTKCCCACGEETTPGMVNRMDWNTGEKRRESSRRLRSCTSCEMQGKLRDRDIQASRNILWIAICEYYGLERPEYLQKRKKEKIRGADRAGL